MKGIKQYIVWLFLSAGFLFGAKAQSRANPDENVIWTSQSANAAASMPCGGGDVGLNVWVEHGELFLYIARSGTFDENNTLLKLGRMRLKLSPNPFDEKSSFKQELVLKDGYVKITGARGSLRTEVNVWVDVFKPVVHLDVKSNHKTIAVAGYESWRHNDRITKGKENNQNSYKWAPQGEVKTFRDSITFNNKTVLFFHQNKAESVFDVTVKQQGMESLKDELFNPLKNLVFGGSMQGDGMMADGNYSGSYAGVPFKGWKLKNTRALKSIGITIALHTAQAGSVQEWLKGLAQTKQKAEDFERDFKASKKWWNAYWQRSFIHMNNEEEQLVTQAGKNYQLFRYMLGCNAFGTYPTKFNGGLFTYDPVFVDTTLNFTPDFRNWGGGTHTAQNQRLVYWPMLKSGDADLMRPQFDFYIRLLKNAEIRTAFYWKHKGASFTEQLENFGLPNPAEYGWKRPEGYDPGMEYNAWLEYQWDTVLEFCQMMLEIQNYAGKDVKEYLPFIESCVSFFDAHYTMLARQRGSKALDADGHLILYPGSAAETYKMAYNASSTIAALKTVLGSLLALEGISEQQRTDWTAMLKRIPPLSFRDFGGHPTIAPAKTWERVNNTESPQLYPVFPWGIYGIGRSGLDTAINTFKYDADVLKFRSHVGWKQDNIFAARLGLTAAAAELNLLKLKDSGRRFPAFWGPGFDWVPDHNWGGSGMMGLQEMLLQSHHRKIYVLPAWPKEWDVHFKLHAPDQTTVEVMFKKGKLELLRVVPESRRKDIILMMK
ncbi:DUF5703 domain-containing protein [Pedobacter africanus]|uniref:DUF5703 domain-containing protein n=1 Tax=Pedobacter africanus TaxID=151894 RepID=A0A1W1YQ79_9SPHI|nr:DUF5703 domain-containing protein [Pedobacter africanus]SMC38304.1 hypothetical protein SAMN04488524_0113 [Pedobacter africanus]